MSRGARLAAWSVFLVLTLRLLHGPAFGHLSIPLDSLGELAAWSDRTAPSAMALAVVRLVAIAAAWYLTGATVLAVAADLAGLRRTALVVAALSPAVVRRLASRSAGVGLAAGALLAVTPMPTRLAATPANASTRQADAPRPPTATMTRHPHTPPTGTPQPSAPAVPADTARPGNATAPTMTRLPGVQPTSSASSDARALPADLAPSGEHPAPTMARLPGGPPTGTTLPGASVPADMPGHPAFQPESTTPPAMTRLAATNPAPATPTTATMSRLPGDPTATRGDGGPAERWPVAQGDSFWSIAHEALTDHLGHRPTDDDLSRYWRHLIAANRHRLPDPANCDLLVPGQQLELPPPA